MPDGEQRLGFEDDVKPLFREQDRQQMEWAFDLWDYQNVKDYAEDILERLEAGDMPCDGGWPEEQIATFRNWMQGGMAP